jgi:hypothetical protein
MKKSIALLLTLMLLFLCCSTVLGDTDDIPAQQDIKVIVDDPAHPYVEPVKPDSDRVKIIPQDLQAVAGKVSVMKIGGDLMVNVSRNGLSAKSASLTLTIHDLQGVLLLRRQIEGSAVVPVAHLANKPYVVRLKNAGKVVFQKRFK